MLAIVSDIATRGISPILAKKSYESVNVKIRGWSECGIEEMNYYHVVTLTHIVIRIVYLCRRLNATHVQLYRYSSQIEWAIQKAKKNNIDDFGAFVTQILHCICWLYIIAIFHLFARMQLISINLHVSPPQKLPQREELKSFIVRLFQIIIRFTLKSAWVPHLEPIIAPCLTGWHCAPFL